MPRAGWLAFGGVAAALLSEHLAALALLATLLAALLVVARAWRCRWLRVGLLAAGAVAVLVRALVGTASAVAPASSSPPHADEWRAEVISLAAPREGRQPAIVLVTPVTADDADGSPEAPADSRNGGLRAYLRLPRYPSVVPGDGIRFRAELTPAPTDGGFGEYLARNGVTAIALVHEFEPESGAADAAAGLERVRRTAADLLAETLPEPQAGLATGILIGIRDRMGRAVADAFTASGLSHIVAISGWNIALLGGVLASLLRRLHRRPRSLLIVVAIALYALLTGASPSVVRAALMGGVVLLARESGRRGAADTALGLAAWAMLVLDPATVTDAGYRLSVAATAGLLAWSTPLTARVRAFLPGRSPAWLVESLSVSLAAQAATLPLVLADFGRLSLVAPLANLLVAPLVAPAMFVAAVALAAGWLVSVGLPSALAVAVGTAGWALLGAIVAIARITASLPYASVDVAPPSNLAGAALAALALFTFGTPAGRTLAKLVLARAPGSPAPGSPRSASHAPPRPRRSSIAIAASTAVARQVEQRRPSGAIPASRAVPLSLFGVAAVAALLALVSLARPDGRLRMTVLDVGQGDAILLEGPRGGRVLVDAGPDPDRVLALLDERLPPWDRRIDLVILSHPHEDHVAGLALLLTRYRVASVAETGVLGPGPGYEAYREELERAGRMSRRLGAGDELSLDGARINVLWPPRDIVPERAADEGKGLNNLSIVLDVRFGQRRMLLGGDIEQDIDPQLLRGGLASGGQPLDVLKVAHHGSRTATTPEFLRALRPRIAIISAGARNRYGHPAARTLEHLAAAGVRTLRTDRDGSVTASSNGHDLEVRSSGGRPDARSGSAPATGGALYVPFDPAIQRPGDAPLPRIAAWSPVGATRFSCSFPSSRPNGSSLTSARSLRSPPSWPLGSRRAGTGSTVAWSRPPPSSTTSTSCSSTRIPCGRSPMVMPAPDG